MQRTGPGLVKGPQLGGNLRGELLQSSAHEAEMDVANDFRVFSGSIEQGATAQRHRRGSCRRCSIR